MKEQERSKSPARRLAFCGMCLALGFVASYIQIIRMPFGGTVTFFSMLLISFVGYCYGIRAGLLTAFAYGVLQFIQDPFMLTPFQVCCDYLLAFSALGLSGLFSESKHGLLKGYLLGIILRGAFHSLGGYLYWMEYMPENFPEALKLIYPIVYNYSYILAEGVITVILLMIPTSAKAFVRIKKMVSM